jgi:APA family basic amino acid/polyamine antiporter
VGSGWIILLCWFVGGLVALAGALSYAELATMMPRAGGEYAYLREIYGPLPAFLSGWTSFFVGFSAPVAASAVAFSTYLTAAGFLPATPFAQESAAVAVVVFFTTVHYCGVQLGARVQTALTGLNLALIAALILSGFLAGEANWRFLAAGSDFFGAGNWAQAGFALLLVMFSYSGWNAAAYLGEEVADPARNLPRSLAIGTFAVMLIYVLVNLFYFAAAPVTRLSGAVAVAEVAATSALGPAAGRWLAVAISVSLLSSLSAYMLIGPRVYYAMARDGLFFPFASRIHPRFHTPALSIVAQGLLAVILALSGTFDQLLTYIGFALGIFPWMTIAGLLLLRRREPHRERPYRVWGYPFTPLFYLVVSVGILVVAFQGRPGPSSWAIATILAGIPVYWFIVRRR